MVFETLAEIAAVVSILIKFGHDDIIEDKNLFIAFLNELGITINGKKVTAGNLFNLTQDITNRQKEQLIAEFNIGHAPIYKKLAMYTNTAKF
ncbi:anti-sigma 70 protein [Acinetobacter phage vB_AbaM_PhT2]|uniref:Anti-sigma 70 protein n=2 Tax=Hadassahvirus TaxID=2842716 RepID=A0A6B9SVJ7_9CAUD|nr:anti-sigma factor [Acinetobacter phage AbTZA1]YP_009887108.1 anti-sigma factor [Acinetobacter phage vB_AbaM_PhT2]QQM13991.1 anti-sigma 70 protein [Acinetobacter phage Maestro]QQM18744.1 anti-sigma 70 protein [Acinetobacter phage Morttis]QQO96445.1 anti-sigma factor [Acinetobacter phage Minot]QQO96694.1 anti-sigma factor [Acinetobacter phage Mokit]QQO96947.1 anti-sigma 70 protein [Acinetobacter phage Melin]UQS94323.1 anti-sigma 70 protein [Acinetobacter phage AB-Navy71]SSU39461.1 Anti-Sig